MIFTKRVYEKKSRADGYRILVDGLWPRGLSKEKAAVDRWLKEIAPSAGLRTWFSHAPARWDGFRRRYGQELRRNQGLVDEIKALEQMHKTVTLLYAARDTARNNAVALREHLRRKT